MMEQSKIKAPFDKKKNIFKKFLELIKPYWNQLLAKPRHEQILLVFTIEAILAFALFMLLIILANFCTIIEKIITITGVWTLITLLISSPIAFFVWKFRDENTVHQLENQRKDVNLKEFQKIAEWVSGLHLVEDKIVEKTKKIENPAENNSSRQEGNQDETTDTTPETETSREYGQAGTSRHIPSHSRQDGSVGLQVAAVYMLKPFYCGEHGDSFRKPALHLLTSTWLALFKQLEQNNKNKLFHNKSNPKELKNSPLAIALTQVLLADGGVHFSHYPEVFPNLYLPYLNLDLPGLDKEKILEIFSGKIDCSGINLRESNFFLAKLKGANLPYSNLKKAIFLFADLREAKLKNSNLSESILNNSNLENANLIESNLSKADLRNANLKYAELQMANLKLADLRGAKLIYTNLYMANLSNIKINQETKWEGSLLNLDNFQYIKNYINCKNENLIIKAPEAEGALIPYIFKKNNFQTIYNLPHTLIIEELEKINPEWEIIELEAHLEKCAEEKNNTLYPITSARI